MKRILLLWLAFAMFACTSDNQQEDEIIGKWSDNIHLSQDQVSFDARANEVTITTLGDSWWLAEIFWNDEVISSDVYYQLAPSFTIESEDFTVIRENKTTLKIALNANNTGQERAMTIVLEDGDYFGQIHVTQQAK